VFLVAAGYHYANVGIDTAHLQEYFFTVHAGHDHIENYHVYPVVVFTIYFESLEAIGGGQDMEAGEFKHFLPKLADGIIVISQQDRSASFPAVRAIAELFANSRNYILRDRKDYLEGCPLARFTVNSQRSLVPSYNPSTAANPRPLPVNLVVKNGSKIRFRVSGSMPLPVSDTSSQT